MFTSYRSQQFTRYPTTVVPDLSAGFDTPEATIQLLGPSDSASVTVTATGPNTAKKFRFDFKLPRGKQGQPGADGITPVIDPDTKHWIIGDTDTGVTAQGVLEGSSLKITQAQNFLVQLNGNNVPVGVLTDKGNYYPVQKHTLTIDTAANNMVLDLTQYIVADGSTAFNPPWTVYFAAGQDGASAYAVWLQQGNQGTQEDFFQYLRGQTYRYAFTAQDIVDNKLTVDSPGCPVSISDQEDVTYPLQFGSYTVTGQVISINMDTQLSAIGKPVEGTWYLNIAASGQPGPQGKDGPPGPPGKDGVAGGYGNVLGGLGMRITAYTSDSTAATLTLDGNSDSNFDWSLLQPSSIVRINNTGGDYFIDSDSQQQLYYLKGYISSVNQATKTVVIDGWYYAQSTQRKNISSNITAQVQQGQSWLYITDDTRRDAAFSTGDKNFVTGHRAAADGSWNTVTGDMAHASGGLNTVAGDLSHAFGTSNNVQAQSTFVAGVGNTVKETAGLSTVIGGSNEVQAFGSTIIGNLNTGLIGTNMTAIGNSNEGSGKLSTVIGNNNTMNGQSGRVLGFGNTMNAQFGTLIGMHGTLDSYAQNRGAFAVAIGQLNQAQLPFIVRGYKAVLNPLFNSDSITDSTQLTAPNPKDRTGQFKYNSQPAYSVQYTGHFLGTTQNVAHTGTVILDHDMYSRWVLTGTGDVTLQLQNWLDGDYGQIVVNTGKQTIAFPAQWISDGADIVTSPGQYVLGISMAGDAVYCKVVYPAVATAASSAASSVQLAVVTGDIDTVNKTVQVRAVTVDDNGNATYTGQTITARYDFTAPAV